jgi:hypothetical protein
MVSIFRIQCSDSWASIHPQVWGPFSVDNEARRTTGEGDRPWPLDWNGRITRGPLKLFVRSREFDELVMKAERLALILNPREGSHHALVKVLREEERTTYCKHLCLAQITKHDADAPQCRGDI